MFPTRDPGDGKYVGNVFGPFWTKVAIIVIGGLSLLFVALHYIKGEPFDLGDPNQEYIDHAAEPEVPTAKKPE
ncbi:MAG: hypothetical protein AAF741_16215 [Bacteroidota bacterium]